MTLDDIHSLLDETRTDLTKSGVLPKAKPFPGQLMTPGETPTGRGHIDAKKATAYLSGSSPDFTDTGVGALDDALEPAPRPKQMASGAAALVPRKK